ncbi:MAG: dTDP-4-dehydrorhamnose 3,5-epimerase [Chitinophagales bacterium]|nr:MAG: dTDP-4-dehydrorhamnose 3,5-epimerase [Chitinophagales bacterium]
MKVTPTEIPGLLIIEPVVYTDERGLFFESYNQKALSRYNLPSVFVQDNQSFSKYGVLRGLHFQHAPYEQAKLVRVLQGEVFDVAVDLRKGSPTYGKWKGVVLSASNRKQLFIPRGFAHGFLVLSPTAEFFYKCDNFYSKAYDGGIRYDDPDLNIQWPLPEQELILSDKDRNLPLLKEASVNFTYQA